LADQAELSRLHHKFLRHVIDEGQAPSVGEMAIELDKTEGEIKETLLELSEYHGAVLQPGSHKVWVMHPFSLAPTNFLVHNKEGEWWSSCAWCALGAAALLKSDINITTSLGAVGKQVELHIRDGEVVEKDYLVHFPIAMERAWDNVIYTCSTMLLFESEAQVDDWSAKHGIAKGDVQAIDRIWKFAQVWYGKHLDEDWTKWTVDEAKEIFARFGLSHSVWQLSASGERF
jgi:hypothetical protein